MAKLRKFCAYRRLERPYTRTSKYRKKSFVRVRPHSKVVKYNMGNLTRKFDSTFDLLSKADLQIRHNSLESARLTCNRHLEKNLGKGGFYFVIRAFPHHILRENPLASGAGADRMSTGMKMSFGKPIGVAAQVRRGSPLLSVSVPKNQQKVAREALKKASKKFPCGCSIVERVVKAAEKQTQKAEVPKEEIKPESKTEEKTEEKPVKTVEQEESKPEEVKTEEKAEPKAPAEEAKEEKPVEDSAVEQKPAEKSVPVENPEAEEKAAA